MEVLACPCNVRLPVSDLLPSRSPNSRLPWRCFCCWLLPRPMAAPTPGPPCRATGPWRAIGAGLAALCPAHRTIPTSSTVEPQTSLSRARPSTTSIWAIRTAPTAVRSKWPAAACRQRLPSTWGITARACSRSPAGRTTLALARFTLAAMRPPTAATTSAAWECSLQTPSMWAIPVPLRLPSLAGRIP